MNKRRMGRIDKESKIYDNSNMPFSFSKPFKHKSRVIYYECSKCGYGAFIGKNTVMYTCLGCGKLEKVKKN